MGFVDFVKEAGEKLWDNLTANKGDNQTSSQSQALKNYLSKAKITTETLDITVNDGVAKVSGSVPDQATKEKIIVMLGNVHGIAKVDDNLTVQNQSQSTASTHFYTVKTGDTLSSIAEKVYGNGGDYMKIFDANKPMLTSPDHIYPGQVLRIPQTN